MKLRNFISKNSGDTIRRWFACTLNLKPIFSPADINNKYFKTNPLSNPLVKSWTVDAS